jgi:hypothetical protein
MYISYSSIRTIINSNLNKSDYQKILRFFNNNKEINTKNNILLEIIKNEKNNKKIKLDIEISDELFLKEIENFNLLEFRLFFLCFISFKPILVFYKSQLNKLLFSNRIVYKDIEKALTELQKIILFRYSISKTKINLIFLNRFKTKTNLAVLSRTDLRIYLLENLELYEPKIIKLVTSNKQSIAYIIYQKNNNIKSLLDNQFFFDFIFQNKSLL